MGLLTRHEGTSQGDKAAAVTLRGPGAWDHWYTKACLLPPRAVPLLPSFACPPSPDSPAFSTPTNNRLAGPALLPTLQSTRLYSLVSSTAIL